MAVTIEAWIYDTVETVFWTDMSGVMHIILLATKIPYWFLNRLEKKKKSMDIRKGCFTNELAQDCGFKRTTCHATADIWTLIEEREPLNIFMVYH